MAAELNVLCAGAVKGLAAALQPRFESETGVRVHTQFGAVGAIREAMRAGAPCDVLVVTDTMIDSLVASGELQARSKLAIGRVQTAIAVLGDAARPAIGSAAELKAALLGASALYFPDSALSTAGAHVASLLERLGIRETLASRLRMFANGATAMRALADSNDARAIGCTQATEIRAAVGIAVVGALPPPFALATVYSAAIATSSGADELGRRFIALLAGAASLPLGIACGFDAS